MASPFGFLPFADFIRSTDERTAPADNTNLNAPATFTITATASDPDGTVSKVEFFQGITKLGEDVTAPYSFDVSGLAQGDYSFTARATDNFGAFTNSAAITVHVLPPLTTPPTVSIISPADGTTFLAPASITINANAADSDGTVSKVEFFNGATKLGEDTSAPYSFAWSNVAIGSYSLTAKATDDMTATTTSAAITVNVVVNQSPSITLTAPADLATNIGTGGTVTLSADVSDPESQPMDVTFYGRLKSPPVGPDFTLVTLPDTQFYSENTGGTRLQHFLSQTNWIVANRSTLNIPFVAHMGDMVQNGDSVQQEWINADSAMDILEDPLTTLLTHGIPWGGAPGNHDQQPIGSPDGASAFWNTYFGTARWAGRCTGWRWAGHQTSIGAARTSRTGTMPATISTPSRTGSAGPPATPTGGEHMIRVSITYGDLMVEADFESDHYSPDVVEDMTTRVASALLATLQHLWARQP